MSMSKPGIMRFSLSHPLVHGACGCFLLCMGKLSGVSFVPTVVARSYLLESVIQGQIDLTLGDTSSISIIM